MSRFFIDRPIFAWVIAIVIMLAGVMSITRLPISRYPDHRAAFGHDPRDLPRRLGADGGGFSDADHRAEHERARRPALHVLDQRVQRRCGGDAHLRQRRDPDIAQVQVQNKLQQAPCRCCRRSCSSRASASPRPNPSFLLVVGFVSEDGRTSTRRHRRLPGQNLSDAVGARRRASAIVQLFGSQLRHAHLARPGRSSTPTSSPRRTIWSAPSAAERAGGGRPARRHCPRRPASSSTPPITAQGAAADAGAVPRTS